MANLLHKHSKLAFYEIIFSLATASKSCHIVPNHRNTVFKECTDTCIVGQVE